MVPADNSQRNTLIARVAPYQWAPGKTGNPHGRPKGFISLRRRFREAFLEAPPGDAESLVDVVLKIARGRTVKCDEDGEMALVESKQQMEAIKFAAAYGFGLPEKKLDDDTTARLAIQMVQQMKAEVAARIEAESAAIDVDVKP